MTHLYIYVYETQSRAHQAEYRRFISRAHFCHHHRRAPPAPFSNVYIHSKPNRASAAFSVSRNINRHTMPPQTIFIKCIHMGRRCVNHRTARAALNCASRCCRPLWFCGYRMARPLYIEEYMSVQMYTSRMGCLQICRSRVAARMASTPRCDI